MSIVKYINGNIIDAPQKYIAHGVNCQNVMGSGVAKVLFTKYPEIKKEYHYIINTVKALDSSYYLGKGIKVICSDKIIYNLFTQNFFGYDNKRYVNYWTIAKCFKDLSEKNIKEVAIPKIGCGLGGGDWDIISELINDSTGNDLDVYVYHLD